MTKNLKCIPVVDIIHTPCDNAEQLCRQVFNAVTKEIGCPFGSPALASVRFDNDHAVQILNKKFRQKNEPTNILSFPTDKEDIFDIDEKSYYLGDLILAKETILKEASKQSKLLKNHLQHLLIHGLLHLYGYDHIKESDAEKMESLEIKILKTLNIPNPYIIKS